MSDHSQCFFRDTNYEFFRSTFMQPTPHTILVVLVDIFISVLLYSFFSYSVEKLFSFIHGKCKYHLRNGRMNETVFVVVVWVLCYWFCFSFLLHFSVAVSAPRLERDARKTYGREACRDVQTFPKSRPLCNSSNMVLLASSTHFFPHIVPDQCRFNKQKYRLHAI